MKHDGETPTEDESLSPTTERLAVYLWMTIIDKRLHAYISREYSHDLQTMTLEDIQPRIAENIQSILETINTSEDIQIQYARSDYSNRRHQSTRPKDSKPVSAPRKMCILCKASGRQHIGHDAGSCWFTSRYENQQIARALLVETDADQTTCHDNIQEEDISYVNFEESIISSENN